MMRMNEPDSATWAALAEMVDGRDVVRLALLDHGRGCRVVRAPFGGWGVEQQNGSGCIEFPSLGFQRLAWATIPTWFKPR